MCVCLHSRVQVLELHVTVSCLTWLPATSQCLHAQLLNAQPSLQPSLHSHFSFCAGDWQSLFGSSSLCRSSPETHFQWFLVTLGPQQRVACIALCFTTAEEARAKSGKGMGVGEGNACWGVSDTVHMYRSKDNFVESVLFFHLFSEF